MTRVNVHMSMSSSSCHSLSTYGGCGWCGGSGVAECCGSFGCGGGAECDRCGLTGGSDMCGGLLGLVGLEMTWDLSGSFWAG